MTGNNFVLTNCWAPTTGTYIKLKNDRFTVSEAIGVSHVSFLLHEEHYIGSSADFTLEEGIAKGIYLNDGRS